MWKKAKIEKLLEAIWWNQFESSPLGELRSCFVIALPNGKDVPEWAEFIWELLFVN